ncbi:CAP domain-containing protein [Pseudomonas viridiflava]|uniref:CAP domain-containing protein n=1 Tax=Pseudomonas viridiflava TaxID=33069 RepID=UPI000F015D85|nr:CAP domain-containing protein [Pseudomonas viridiflava]
MPIMRKHLRFPWRVRLCLISFASLFAVPAMASEGQQIVQSINAYRAQPQRCESRTTKAARPLVLNDSVTLPIVFNGSSRDALKVAGYQAVTVRTIRLAGAQDANEAFGMLKARYCGALLDAQYADVGITRERNDWRIVLARPLIDSKLSDTSSAGKLLLAQINEARSKPRMCGKRPFAAAQPVVWNATLELAAQGHSQSMASENYFQHRGFDGDSPADRARAAGYSGRQIGENIAAGQSTPGKAMASWLASPGHCANLMNPMFTEVGVAYATGPQTDYGVYWTMLFGGP